MAYPLPTLKGRGRGVGCRRLVLQPRRHYGQQRKQTQTQPKKPEESTVDATSSEQECRTKPCAAWSEQSRVKEKGKRPKTREWQYKKRTTSVAGTVDRTASRRESRRDRWRSPRAREPGHPRSQGSRPREHQQLPKNTYKRTVISPARR